MSLELEALVEFLTGSRMTASSVPWWLLRPEDVRVIRSWAGETLPAGTQRGLMRALRNELRLAATEEESATGLVSIRHLVRSGRRRLLSRGPGPREVKRLVEATRAGDSDCDRRDAAVLTLMLMAGLRRREVVDLQLGDYDEEDGRLVVRSARRQVRSVILQGECREDLELWLSRRGSFSGPLFVRIDPQAGPQPLGLRAWDVNRLLARRCLQAGGLRLTPRDLRSRFLWQVQLAGNRDQRPPCRYYQDENGQPAWTLASIGSL